MPALLGHPIHPGHVAFTRCTLFSICTLSWVFSPRFALPHPGGLSTESRWSPPSFGSGAGDAKALLLSTLGISPHGPQTNKSTVLQSHRKPALNLCWVTLGKFRSIPGLCFLISKWC